MTESEKLLAQLKELMECPVDWIQIDEDHRWWSILQLDWYHCLAQYAVDEHDLPFDPDFFEDTWDETEAAINELRSTLVNLELRRPQAEELYLTRRAGQLKGLQFMTASGYGKHYLAGITEAEAMRRSTNGTSYFWRDYSGARLQDAFWCWFRMYFDIVTDYSQYTEFLDPESDAYKSTQAQKWREFIEGHHLRICMNTVQSIGACDGEFTSYICYDVHIDSKTVHCYPVSEAEARQIMREDEVLNIDGLNC